MKLKAPNAFVLLVGILALVTALSWVIPPGHFQREAKEIPGVGTRNVVVKNSFKPLKEYGELTEAERKGLADPGKDEIGRYEPQGPWDALRAPMRVFEDKDCAHTVAFILLIGGAFGVLQGTGALVAGLYWITRNARGAGRHAVIPLLMTVFSLGGAVFGMAEETLLFVLITVPLACSLGYDTLTGAAIPFVGSQAGFATAFINPFSFGIAKGIAGQPPDVGFGYRLLCWLVVTGVCIALVMWHANRVAKDPSKSPTPEVDAMWRSKVPEDGGKEHELTPRRKGVLLTFAGSMVLLGYGSVYEGWYVVEIAALFMGMALACGIVGGLAPGQIADSFIEGSKDLCATAVLVAFARSIFFIAEESRMIDTTLNSLADMLQDSSPELGVQLMYLTQTCINFFVPSGSGQAALTMPVMDPLAEALSIHKEHAILAFQFGDGFTNLIIPTSPICVGVATAAGAGYAKWFRWMLPRQILLFAVGAALLYLAPDFAG